VSLVSRRIALLFFVTSLGCHGAELRAGPASADAGARAGGRLDGASAVPPSAAPGAAAPEASAPPAALACIAEHYVGEPLLRHEAWWLGLPDGSLVPYDDGRSKTDEERLDEPDVEDVLALEYSTGPIAPVTDPAHDPGRRRISPLLRATYGADARAVSSALVPVKLAGHTVFFHRRAAPALERVASRIDALLRVDPTLARFFRELGGTFAARAIAGTRRLSAHAWGIAIDIDTSRADYWRDARGGGVWRNRIPESIVDAFEAEGFAWGGRWFHYDTMHFEWRPELFDPRCRP
jgi:hypothetical protein